MDGNRPAGVPVGGRLPLMGPTYTVHASTEAVCERELERLCEALDAVPCLLPREVLPGTGRWMARAKPQPHEEAGAFSEP